jgi:hypothetical protein
VGSCNLFFKVTRLRDSGSWARFMTEQQILSLPQNVVGPANLQLNDFSFGTCHPFLFTYIMTIPLVQSNKTL